MAGLIMQPTAAVSDRLKTQHGIRLTAAVFAVVMLIAVCIFSPGTQIVLSKMAETSTPTPAPGTKRTDEHGIAQVYVPAGCFMMGSTDQQIAALNKEYNTKSYNNEGPQHEVCITKGYWIDAYEVTNAAYQHFIDAGGYTTRDYWSDVGWQWKSLRPVPGSCLPGGIFDAPQQPRVCITWYEAEAYANWRGGRLPTEAEWEYAARGPDSLIYPWGNTWEDGKAHTYENHYWRTKPVGSYEHGKSWVGTYDLAGNADEWVADWYSETYYQQREKDNPQGPVSGTYRVMRSGSWYDSQSHTRSAKRIGVKPAAQDSSFGCRVVVEVRSSSR